MVRAGAGRRLAATRRVTSRHMPAGAGSSRRRRRGEGRRHPQPQRRPPVPLSPRRSTNSHAALTAPSVSDNKHFSLSGLVFRGAYGGWVERVVGCGQGGRCWTSWSNAPASPACNGGAHTEPPHKRHWPWHMMTEHRAEESRWLVGAGTCARGRTSAATRSSRATASSPPKPSAAGSRGWGPASCSSRMMWRLCSGAASRLALRASASGAADRRSAAMV